MSMWCYRVGPEVLTNHDHEMTRKILPPRLGTVAQARTKHSCIRRSVPVGGSGRCVDASCRLLYDELAKGA